MSVCPNRGKGWRFAMATEPRTVYVDDSGTDPNQRIVSAAFCVHRGQVAKVRGCPAMRDPKERLRDILEAIGRVEQYASRGGEAFDKEELVQVWMVHHLEVIGEAAAQFDRDFHTALPRGSLGRKSLLYATCSCTNILASISTSCGTSWSVTSGPSKGRSSSCSQNWSSRRESRRKTPAASQGG